MGQQDLKKALTNLEEERVYNIIKEELTKGLSAREILKACQGGMKEIGDLYTKEEYFVADLMYAGEIMRKVMEMLTPHMKGTESEDKVGTVVIGTVKGDIHDIGKDVVIITLQGNGFEVIDLGVDVPAERFVEAIKESGAQVMGMSVFLTSCFEFVVNIVKAITDAGLRDRVKIMIGGAPVTETVAEKTRCDFFGKDAQAGVNYALKVVGAL